MARQHCAKSTKLKKPSKLKKPTSQYRATKSTKLEELEEPSCKLEVAGTSKVPYWVETTLLQKIEALGQARNVVSLKCIFDSDTVTFGKPGDPIRVYCGNHW